MAVVLPQHLPGGTAINHYSFCLVMLHVVKCPSRDPKWDLPNGGGYVDCYYMPVIVVICVRAVTSMRKNTE